MKIFLYEHVTGGGCFVSHVSGPIPQSLLREGQAMVEALACDLAAIDGVSVTLSLDQRMPISAPACRIVPVRSRAEAETVWNVLAVEADLVLVIAPESEGALFDRCRRVKAVGGQLLGPGLAAVKLCSDKHATAEHLAAAGASAPLGLAVDAGQMLPVDFNYPAVIKPRDGCGSQDITLIASAADAVAWGPVAWPARLEEYCPGVAASVAVLCGPRELRVMPPCRQRLSKDGRFQYLGGAFPLPPQLARRGAELALRAVSTLPEPRGYVGVDLVLRPDEQTQVQTQDSPIFAGQKLGPRRGRISIQPPGDFVIEINPRLTTSYVGLRAACRGNLAEAMLRISAGKSAELSFRDDPLQFDADGTVRFLQDYS